jgi:hypothetical protein
MKQELKGERGADHFGDVAGDNGDLRQEPKRLCNGRAIVLAA